MLENELSFNKKGYNLALELEEKVELLSEKISLLESKKSVNPTEEISVFRYHFDDFDINTRGTIGKVLGDLVSPNNDIVSGILMMRIVTTGTTRTDVWGSVFIDQNYAGSRYVKFSGQETFGLPFTERINNKSLLHIEMTLDQEVMVHIKDINLILFDSKVKFIKK